MTRYGLIIRRLFERQQVVHPVPCYGKRDSHPEPPIAHSLRFNCLIINLQPVPRLFVLGDAAGSAALWRWTALIIIMATAITAATTHTPLPDAAVAHASALSPRPPTAGPDAVVPIGACILKCAFEPFPMLGMSRNSSASRTKWSCRMADRPRGCALQPGGLCRAAGPHPPDVAGCGTVQHAGQRRTTHKSPSTVDAL